LQELLKKERAQSHLIAALHKAQQVYGYLSREAMDEISQTMQIPTAHIWGVATFYHYFTLKPRGKYTLYVCQGTACYVKGSEAVLKAIKEKLGIEVGETTEDRLFTLTETRCLGACGLAPVIMINDKVYGELTPQKVTEILESYWQEERRGS